MSDATDNRFYREKEQPSSNVRCEHLELTKCDNDGDGTFCWICTEPGCDFSTPDFSADHGSWSASTRLAPEPTTGHWYDAEDIDRLVRELDVWLNGEAGAAKQAKLCDVVAQITRRSPPPTVARWRCVSYCLCNASTIKGHFERDDVNGVWVKAEDVLPLTKTGTDPYKRCQHDLLAPATTIEVIDKWKARCVVCIEFFDLPGRPIGGTAGTDGETDETRAAPSVLDGKCLCGADLKPMGRQGAAFHLLECKGIEIERESQ